MFISAYKDFYSTFLHNNNHIDMTKLTSSEGGESAAVQCCNVEVGHHVITVSRHPGSPEADNHNFTCGNTALPTLFCISRLLDQLPLTD